MKSNPHFLLVMASMGILSGIVLALPPMITSQEFNVKNYFTNIQDNFERIQQTKVESAIVVTTFDQPIFIPSPCANSSFVRTTGFSNFEYKSGFSEITLRP
jgi:hypothetical protein